ncbi:MAG: glycosyltransferase [Lachnospiraceae bacterium]|nr:glycosyltransferase [Lachnospiraceae bacterium]
MAKPTFSIIIWAHDSNEAFLRDCIEAVSSQTYDKWELYVLDNNSASFVSRIVSEFFPEDLRAHYRKLKTNGGEAYALNVGAHFVLTNLARVSKADEKSEYMLLLNQHDRLNPDTLEIMANMVDGVEDVSQWPDVIYTDEDEIAGVDRVNPKFKTGFNKELLLHRDYIGDFFAISVPAVRTIGEFQTKLVHAVTYDYLLRAMERRMTFAHVPSLIYHRRQIFDADYERLTNKEKRGFKAAIKREYMVAAEASLRRQGVEGKVVEGTDESYWLIDYDGDDYEHHSRDYIFLKKDGIKTFTKEAKNVKRMYGLIKQPDVAVVGGRFIKSGFAIENCGYIYDSHGIAFPAFYNQKIYRPTYMQLASIPRDVSAVDFDYCMLDAKIYRKLGGLDANLSGRDLMLDYCMRANERGYRVVVDPAIIIRGGDRDFESTQESSDRFNEKWKDKWIPEDPFYNRNLPMGLENFRLDI